MCINLSDKQVLGSSKDGVNSTIVVSIDQQAKVAHIIYMMMVEAKKGTLGGFFFYPGYNQFELIETGPSADKTVNYVKAVVDNFTPVSRIMMSFDGSKSLQPTSSQRSYLDGMVVEANCSAGLLSEVQKGSNDKRFVQLFEDGGNAAIETASQKPELAQQPVIGRFYQTDNDRGVVMTTYQVAYEGSSVVVPLYENSHKVLGDFPDFTRRDTNVIVGFSDPRNQYLPAIDNLAFFMPANFKEMPNGNLLVDTSANAVGVKYGAEFIPSESQYQIIA